MMYGWNGNGWGAGTWFLMAVGMLIFWAVVVFGIVALVRYFGHPQELPSATTSDPEMILRERLARGDIDEDEFRRRLATLREKP
jgi:putative membrane protein